MRLLLMSRCEVKAARYIRLHDWPTQGQSPPIPPMALVSPMKCPSCGTVLSMPVSQCPSCQLTLRELDSRFGAVPRHSRFITDFSGRLSSRDIAELQALLRLFNRKFSQSRFSVFLTNQISTGSIGEYAFWLMNRARFGFPEAIGADNFDLLLAIDVQRSAAALVIGYGLEHYVTERDLERALAEAATGFHQGDFFQGIRVCVEFMVNRMREIIKKLEIIEAPRNGAAATTDLP
jgi:uncharacterized membrane protein YgcG